MEFNVDDKVTIIKRNKGNRTGACEYNKPNGDVGKKGYIEQVYGGGLSGRYAVYNTVPSTDGTAYLGIFSADELQLTNSFKVGDKVKLPTTKGKGYGNVHNSAVIKRANAINQEFLYITNIIDDRYTLNEKQANDDRGDYYALEDLVPYEKQVKQEEVNKKYKLIQAYPGSPKVGTIYTTKNNGTSYNYNGGDYTTAISEELLSNTLFFEEVEETVFKKGDYVYVIDCGSHYPNHTDRRTIDNIVPTKEWGKDDVVMRVLSSTEQLDGKDVLVLTDGESSFWFGINTVDKRNRFRLATKEEITKFKESKKVKVGDYELINNNDGTISLGCQTYTLDDVKAVRRTMGIGQLKEVTLRGTVITGKILSLLEAAINRTELPDPTVRVGLKFKNPGTFLVYTITSINSDGTVDLSWPGDIYRGGYKITQVKDFIENGSWVVVNE